MQGRRYITTWQVILYSKNYYPSTPLVQLGRAGRLIRSVFYGLPSTSLVSTLDRDATGPPERWYQSTFFYCTCTVGSRKNTSWPLPAYSLWYTYLLSEEALMFDHLILYNTFIIVSLPRLGGCAQQGLSFEVVWLPTATRTLYDGLPVGMVLCSSLDCDLGDWE